MSTCVYNKWVVGGNSERIRNLQAFPSLGLVCAASESCLVQAPFARCHNGDAGPPNFQKQNLLAAVFSPCRAKTQRPEISPRHAAPSERLNHSRYPCAFCRNRAHLVVVCRYFARSRYLIITTKICPSRTACYHYYSSDICNSNCSQLHLWQGQEVPERESSSSWVRNCEDAGWQKRDCEHVGYRRRIDNWQPA
ncbi:hypothetical protein LY76DRAFT_136656 [Colletotrichum caudatum]|nr:hypothetical protein LY76DRAFT_136656 [Colletotrichum caudatum]